ncbi:MAG: hypothetical protein ABR569_08445 [Gaiellaceae bacterium]
MRSFLGAALVGVVLVGTALAANGEPQKRFRGDDQAWARAIVLHAADLPGWRAGPQAHSTSGSLRCRGFFTPDESDLVVTGETDSRQFARPGMFVAASSSVYRRPADALASWKRNVRPALARCLGQRYETESSPGVTVRVMRWGRLPFAKLTQRTAAFRIVAAFSGNGRTLVATSDLILLSRGRADCAIVLLSTMRRFPSAVELRVARLVAGRLVAPPRRHGA